MKCPASTIGSDCDLVACRTSIGCLAQATVQGDVTLEVCSPVDCPPEETIRLGPIDRAGYLLALIERLAPVDGIEGLEFGECAWCKVTWPDPPGHVVPVDMAIHADDCPWVEARKVLDALRQP